MQSANSLGLLFVDDLTCP